MRRAMVTAVLFASAIAVSGAQKTPGPAWLVRSLDNPSDLQESATDVLDTPILPGSD